MGCGLIYRTSFFDLYTYLMNRKIKISSIQSFPVIFSQKLDKLTTEYFNEIK